MNESFVVRMLSVVANALYCQVPHLIPTMPRVVPDQREKFENDEVFRKLSRESEVRYTGHRDRPLSERQQKFQEECRGGRSDVAFITSGTNFQLSFLYSPWNDHSEDRRPSVEHVDFTKEHGKVHLKSQFIMNGVCVMWRGWLDLQRLDGAARLEFDEERAREEDTKLQDQLKQYNHRLRDFEERQRQYQDERERQAEAEAEVVDCLLHLTQGGASVASTGGSVNVCQIASTSMSAGGSAAGESSNREGGAGRADGMNEYLAGAESQGKALWEIHGWDK